MNIKIFSRELITLFFISFFTSFFSNNAIAQKKEDSGTLQRPTADANVVILQYHHVATDTPNITSVTPAVFAEHMAYLAANYHVIALDKAISAIQNNERLPVKSVAITFDDGFTNILDNAHPILMKHRFEYTIFINPAIINESSNQLTWQQIKKMQPLATFANHTLEHAHLLEKYADENQQQWLERVMLDVNQAEAILLDKLDYSKKWLAYPFGEFNQALKKELSAQGYIGFGQQSGAVSHFSDFGALPRFPAAGIYAKLDSLKVKLNSLAMPLTSIKPTQVEYTPNTLIDDLVLEIEDEDVRLSALACYFKGQKLKSMLDDNTVTVNVNHTTQPGRARINCTAPSKQAPARFYWFSYPIFTATLEGKFLD
jgi:peptidoglycan/xylan/chitin deacetylase (PgdA/CDA1 family)